MIFIDKTFDVAKKAYDPNYHESNDNNMGF